MLDGVLENRVHLRGLVDVVRRGEDDALLASVRVALGDLDAAREDVGLPLAGDLGELLHDGERLPGRELNLRELPDLVDDRALLRVLVVLDRHEHVVNLAIREGFFERASIGQPNLVLGAGEVDRADHLAEILKPLRREVAMPSGVRVGEGLAERAELREEVGAHEVEEGEQLLGGVQERRACEERDVLDALGAEILVELALVRDALDRLPFLPSTVRARDLDRRALLLACLGVLLAKQAGHLAATVAAVEVGADKALDMLEDGGVHVAKEVGLVRDERVGAPGEQSAHEARARLAGGLVVEHGDGVVAREEPLLPRRADAGRHRAEVDNLAMLGELGELGGELLGDLAWGDEDALLASHGVEIADGLAGLAKPRLVTEHEALRRGAELDAFELVVHDAVHPGEALELRGVEPLGLLVLKVGALGGAEALLAGLLLAGELGLLLGLGLIGCGVCELLSDTVQVGEEVGLAGTCGKRTGAGVGLALPQGGEVNGHFEAVMMSLCSAQMKCVLAAALVRMVSWCVQSSAGHFTVTRS